MPLAEIDRKAFALYLRRGHGRARRYLQEHGIAGVGDLIIDACLHDYRYDHQCEPRTTDWLHEILVEYPELISELRPKLLAQFARWPGEDSEEAGTQPDPAQCMQILSALARSGDTGLAEVLRLTAIAESFDWDNLALPWEWVRLDGYPALTELAQRAGAWLIANPDEHGGCWPFLDQLAEESGLSDAWEHLQQAAISNEAIATFLTFCVEAKHSVPDQAGENYKERLLRNWPVERIIEHASQHAEHYPGIFARYGRYAEQKSLQTILQFLQECGDDETSLRLLWVFWRTAMPELSDKVLGWLDTPNTKLRIAAIRAMGQMQHPDIAWQARRRLQATPHDHTLLPLLKRNAGALDPELLQRILAALPLADDDTAHSSGSDLLDLDDDDQSPTLDHGAILNWVYEHTPCSICRGIAIHRLHERQLLTPELINECRLDVDGEIR